MGIFSDLERARRILAGGGVVGMPTETVYGLAGSIQSEAAIREIFEVKQRPHFDPLIVHISRLEQLSGVVHNFPPIARRLAELFWPGPLTLVLPKDPELNRMITAGLDTVAVRMPLHPVARRLIRKAGVPVAAPSANRFGRTSPTTAEHVRAEFGNSVFVVDGGPCQLGLESTVLAIEEGADADKLRILRPGMVTAEAIKEKVGNWIKPLSVEYQKSSISPGHLADHYMPSIPLVIVPAERVLDSGRIAQRLNLSGANYVELILAPNPLLAARELYASMRSLSEGKADFIVVKRSDSQSGENWQAVWDRLEKASSLDISTGDN